MVILPPLQISLNFVAFLGNLIHLHHVNTILLLHDLTYRDQISLLIETFQPRYDVTWMLVNEYNNSECWKNPILKHDKILILTALEHTNIISVLRMLYEASRLNRRSKNIIVSSDFSKNSYETLYALQSQQINVVLADWTLADLVIYAWNPFSVEKFIELNETDFLWTSKTDLTNRKYSGLFFDQLRSMQGIPTDVYAKFESTNIFKVILKRSSVISIDGLELRIIDLIGEAIQSPMKILAMRPEKISGYDSKVYTNILERTYSTFAPVPLRNFQTITLADMFKRMLERQAGNLIQTEGYRNNYYFGDKRVYPHGFEQYVIVVENNTTTTVTALQRIVSSPIIYLWLLFIFIFVVMRCGLQWLIESDGITAATKRKRCVFMCQDTVQLSCGVVMSAKQFASKRYRYTMLAHGATIIPLIAGMFLSGLLYGDYLVHSQTPDIDSIAQLEDSNLTIYASNYIPETEKFARFKNEIIRINYMEILSMISTGNTRYAYIIPEHWTAVLNMEHLKPNGRPLFYVIKERFGGKIRYLETGNWNINTRMCTIVMRLHEHGFLKYFESVNKQIVEPTTTEMQPNTLDTSNVVAEAGGLQEILIVCGIYLVGIFFAIVTFIVEYFSKRNSQ